MGQSLGRVDLKSQVPLSLLCLPKAPSLLNRLMVEMVMPWAPKVGQGMERQQLLSPRSPQRNPLKGL